jgi:uncharacterized protein YrrD
MIKASEIVGRPVIVREGGREAGRIKDIVVDQPGNRVLGFVISEGFLRATKVAPWEGLLAIGPDSVILGASGNVVSVGEAPEIKAVLDGGTSIRGLRLQTTGGKDLGKVEDFQFNEQTGEVEGYELSGGLLADTMGGRTFLPTPPSIELGKDVALVAPEVEGTIRQQSGGIRGVFGKSES